MNSITIDDKNLNKVLGTSEVFKDYDMQNEGRLLKNMPVKSFDKRLYEIIIDLAYSWKKYNAAETDDERKKVMAHINILELEKNKILGQMIN
ncbi:MAG: hypothetical protein PHV30_07310 [Candidatus Margulisbacteria bacterium]|nr:hypothetical protein [Candidatus Margulisiibacteriota bacterium]